MAVNRAAAPRDLLKSEDFGHVRSAFTGSAPSAQARSETRTAARCSLDEVGHMDSALQERAVPLVDGPSVAVDVHMSAAPPRPRRMTVALDTDRAAVVGR